ncbi:cobyrinic acid a,c-diamide synthase [Methyloceanibacter superfactus]|uniref:Hydrogenobyrinate a,c-diamide synthase n=1 Tax=Methyloceanibacter superfactus TaxID=1774969 RepID=A0A1E3W8D2_9HYPH|nr:cobyrinate a,c-diamide synthase [Methyloceanibacter superfactus]ODS01990.1 cobyrinic acid a,c-diamide synthase [Methyloceanibacter superfactus]
MTAPALIVAAPRSGAGKTTVTLALLAALRRRGLAVKAAKTGPDYIDPAFHRAATGRGSVNLDSWAMSPALLDGLATQASAEADILVIEGAMGLFDGIPSAPGRTGATADLAARFAVPVLLVIDVSGQSQSAAALVYGFATHDPRVRIGGVVLNRVASDRHERLVAAALAALQIPILGRVRRDESLSLPERHLGLVQAGEHDDLEAHLAALADMAERCFDLDAIVSLAAGPTYPSGKAAPALPPPGMRIALAQDDAFTFVYPHVVAGWRQAGAELVPFSPLADEAPSETCDACWLPGGYPELHAGRLASAATFRDGLARFAATRPVHGECGGYMVLGEGLEDADGVRHAMTGLLGHATSFAQRKLHLGYRAARLLTDGALGREGARLRGHEFHYASVIETGKDAPLAEIADGEGNALGTDGGRRGHVTGTFFHAIATE